MLSWFMVGAEEVVEYMKRRLATFRWRLVESYRGDRPSDAEGEVTEKDQNKL
jgi:hypothetical protein